MLFAENPFPSRPKRGRPTTCTVRGGVAAARPATGVRASPRHDHGQQREPGADGPGVPQRLDVVVGCRRDAGVRPVVLRMRPAVPERLQGRVPHLSDRRIGRGSVPEDKVVDSVLLYHEYTLTASIQCVQPLP